MLDTFIANIRHAIRTGQPATIGGGVFSVPELERLLSEILALKGTPCADTFAN